MILDPNQKNSAGLAQRARPTIWPVLTAVVLMVGLIGAAAYHIRLQPLPNQWDDSTYADATYVWLDFIHTRGDLLRGIFWGAVYALPHHLPPMVFVTSLIGALVGGETLISMRLAHLVWFLVMLASAYGTGAKLGGRWAGVLSVFMAGMVPLIFFWSKTIMGEPALFAAVGLLFLALVYLGNRPNLLSGLVIGGIAGFGMLTKQHFPISAAGPLALWGVWLAVHYVKAREERKKVILALLGAAAGFLVVAAPWYVLSYQEMLTYASQPPFLLHSLSNLPFLTGALLYLRVLVTNSGWPVLLVLLAGLVWGCVLIAKSFPRFFQDWKLVGVAMLVSSGVINLAVGFGMRNINPRFIVPGFIPLAVLAGLALAGVWQHSKGLRWLVGAALIFQFVFWWSLSFGPNLPNFISLLPLDGDLRPTNMQLSLQTFSTIEAASPSSTQAKVWVVGNYYSFNQPTFANLVREKKYSWQIQELYHWDETGKEVDSLIARISSGDWLALYRQERVFDFEGEELVSRLDDQILAKIKADPAFELVAAYQSEQSLDEVFIFRRRLP